MCPKTFSRFRSVLAETLVNAFLFLLFQLKNDLFLLGNSFCTLRRHLDGREGLVVADPTEKR